MRKLKIIVAPDSFKGSISSIDAGESIRRGICRVLPEAEVIAFPVADGGEGTVAAVAAGGKGRIVSARVTGPLGEPRDAVFCMLPDGNAVIETAEAAGLTLVPAERRDPAAATTYGVGQLIRHALDEGARRMIIGLGGSATTDAGMGMAQALGVSFKDAKGNEAGFGGGCLKDIHTIDMTGLDARIASTEIIAACDVTNPLYGPEGAAHIFSPQKGAGPKLVSMLDRGLRHFGEIVRDQLGKDITEIPGAGAAGGLGAALSAFCGAVIRPGIDTVLDAIGFEEVLKTADLVVTGEGTIDGQSLRGKVPVGIGRRASKFGLPVIVLVGGIGSETGKVYEHGISAVVSIMEGPASLEEACTRAGELLENAAERVIRLLQVGRTL